MVVRDRRKNVSTGLSRCKASILHREPWQQEGAAVAQIWTIKVGRKTSDLPLVVPDEGMGLYRRLRFTERDLARAVLPCPPLPPPQPETSRNDELDNAAIGTQAIVALPGAIKSRSREATLARKQGEGLSIFGFVGGEDGLVTHTWMESMARKRDARASPQQWSISTFPPVSQIGAASPQSNLGRQRAPSKVQILEAGTGFSARKDAAAVANMTTLALPQPTAAWVPPTWKAEDITPIRILGTGGQAVVYLAERDGVPFAFKYATVEQSRQALEGECLLNLMLDSPYLPRCFARIVDPCGVPIGMALEYLEGSDLHHALHRLDAPLSPLQLALLAKDIVMGLIYLHGRGVLHLDLKPLNIMLTGRIQGRREAPRAVVMDLGMACLMQPGQGCAWQSAWSGTVSYLDHLRLHTGPTPVTTASDIFSLGLVFYQMASRVAPFASLDEATQLHLLEARLRHNFLHRPVECSDYWWQLVQRCTAMDPCQRPSLDRILRDLEVIIQAL